MQLIKDLNNKPISAIPGRLPTNLICFSHLRWDFVFQRPQHILTRLSESTELFYIEEPVFLPGQTTPHYVYLKRGKHITIVKPQLPEGLGPKESKDIEIELFKDFMAGHQMADYAFWYYTPMALEFSRGYRPELTVFDCMDELSAFKFAPESIKLLEKELLKKADIVFTGGQSLYEAKKNQHQNIYAFPSSIDKAHFAQARTLKANKKDRKQLGFYGVIDERFDIGLIKDMAKMRPEWDIILVGPVVKIDPDTLPQNSNIYYTGSKTYAELPTLMAGWDLALIPFMLNESTRYISPTKTPEYLAAGLPVVSSAIKDVVHPYGKLGFVSIGTNAADFVAKAEIELNRSNKKEWLQKVDFFLAQNSWDQTCEQMTEKMKAVLAPAPAVYNSLIQS
ncbi:glycosyltransferase family 1 protein [Mucilaginibacter conchicola]|uniref:Glycosyltransferase family 1 protein n=1 Tax=Mucilaginibacter conchicola TaxID=2303333 RepID=A0A372NY46_9SPHI|nr:glycosyltransferase [Mucilaginibacter conchicola]RFZ94824.1 glycosyltransferase family 1 protein [Mucilaginibacter conchicola]